MSANPIQSTSAEGLGQGTELLSNSSGRAPNPTSRAPSRHPRTSERRLPTRPHHAPPAHTGTLRQQPGAPPFSPTLEEAPITLSPLWSAPPWLPQGKRLCLGTCPPAPPPPAPDSALPEHPRPSSPRTGSQPPPKCLSQSTPHTFPSLKQPPPPAAIPAPGPSHPHLSLPHHLFFGRPRPPVKLSTSHEAPLPRALPSTAPHPRASPFPARSSPPSPYNRAAQITLTFFQSQAPNCPLGTWPS